MDNESKSTQLTPTEISQASQKSTIDVTEETKQDISQKDSKITKISVYVLASIFLLALGAFSFWFYQEKKISKPIVTTPSLTATTPTPLLTTAPSLTEADLSTKLLEPSLVPMTNWKTVSFPQNIIYSQGGENRTGKIEAKIPSNWTTKTVQTRTEKGIDGDVCNDFQITSNDGNLFLVIKPQCGITNNDYLSISGQVQKVELTTKKGNDGHDSYTVRYSDSSSKVYHYGEIGVSPGATIDIQKDRIYPYLILQYEPDRYEQWLWTSYDLTFKGAVSSQSTALSTADTIVSTLKLTY